MSVVLDTHMWVWWLTPGSLLSRAERDALDVKAGRHELFLPAISLWALCGSRLRHWLRIPRYRRVFNGVMAILLVASLAPMLA